MNTRRAFVFLAAVAGLLPCLADTYYVSATYGNDDTGDGSRATPYATIAKGYEAAVNAGDEVVVSNDTYTFASALTISSGVTIRGETGNPEDVIVKAKSSNYTGIILNHADATVHSMAVQGFSLKDNSVGGGGIRINAAGGTVSNCVVRNCAVLDGCSSIGGGGIGIMASATKALVTHCVVSNCYDNGLYTTTGGALMMKNGTVRNCLFLKNCYQTTKGRAYGIVRISGGTLENCTVTANYSGNQCSGVYADGGTVRDCIIAGNETMSANASYAVWTGDAKYFTNCVSDVAAINEHCYLVERPFADPTRDDYSPRRGTSAVDTGVRRDWMTGATDLAGNPRVRGSAPDIGCYEIDNAFSATFAASTGAILFTNDLTTFTVDAAPVGSDGIRCQWDWDGDGTYDETVDGATATHRFADFGAAKVVLRVTDLKSSSAFVTTSDYTVYPKIVFVAKGGTATAPYDTKEKATADFRTAYAAAVAGQEIVFAADKYSVSRAASSDTSAFTIAKDVTVRGETGKPEDVVISPSGTNYRIFLLNHPKAVVAGLTVANSTLNANSDYGGGIRLSVNGGTVSNCVVRGCGLSTSSTELGGGGIGIEGSALRALVTHCVVSNCSAVRVYQGGSGSAVLMQAGSVRNCLFLKNRASSSATELYGTVYVKGGTLENCTVADNPGLAKCAGVYATGGTVRNCLIAGNTTESTDNPEYAVWAGTATCFTNCISDVAAINDWCVYCASPYAGQATGNYRPAPGSAPVNGGVNQPWMTGATDIEGNDRICGEKVDVGCYEIDPDAFTATFVLSSGSYGFAFETIGVTVSPSRVGAKGIMCEWDWDGDGTYDETTYGTTTSHVFTAYGTHNVSARVTDISSGSSCVMDAIAFPVHPRVIYVSKTGSGTPPYATPETGTNDLAEAYASAVAGTEIAFVKGTTYTLSSQFTVAKDVTIRSETWNPEDAIIRSDGSQHRLFVLNSEKCMLAGLVITGARAKDYEGIGGGLYITGLGGTLSNCIVRSCCQDGGNSTQGGGGLAVDTAKGLVTHCVISNCWDASGIYGGLPSGIAVLIKGAGCVRNSLIVKNVYAISHATPCGVVRISGGSIENCTLAENSTGSRCSGIWAQGGKIVNCLISDNPTTCETNDMWAVCAGDASCFDHCVSDVAAINESCAYASRAFKHLDRGDYHSAQVSPAVNGGLLRSWMDGATDLDGKPRIQRQPDVGCYERDRYGFAIIAR